MSRTNLNRSLILEQSTQVSDGAGGFTNDWQPLGVLWADVQTGTGRETAAFAATVSRLSCKITVRAAPYGAPSRPVPGQRFREGSRLFHIDAVAEKDTNAQYLTCFAQEEVAS